MKNKKVINKRILCVARTRQEKNKPITYDKSEISDVKSSRIPRKSLYLYAFYFIAACYPLTFGDIGRFPNILWIEILSPIVFFAVFVNMLGLGKPLIPSTGRFSAVAIILLILCSIGHFIFHPVGSENLVNGTNASGGIRAYYGIVVCASIFFSALWISAYGIKHDTDWKNILRLFLWVSLFIGYARLITYFLGLSMPMMAGVFDYNEELYLIGGAQRIGGLTESATMGLAALLALSWSRQWTSKTYAYLFALMFLMVMSGGRSSMIGVFIALVAYFVILRKEPGKAVLFILFLLVVAIVALQFDIFATQYQRLSNIEGGIEANKVGRGVIYAEMWRIYLGHPIFGKGIGAQFVNPGLPPFVYQQVVMGGHGAYMSILSLYGVVGVIHFIANLFAPIKKGINALRNNRLSNFNDSGIFATIVFVVISLIILSIEFIVGGNGYNYPRLYLYAGISAGVLFNLRLT